MRIAIDRARRGVRAYFEARIYPCAGVHLDLAVTIISHLDANQQVEYLVCTGVDITERKRVEEELQNLIEAIPQLIWIACPDGAIIYNNRRLCDYIGMTSEAAEGDDWKVYVHPDDRQRVLDAWQIAIHTGTTYEVEYRLRDGTSGMYRWFLTRGIPLKDNQGTIQQWFGTCTDINEQKLVEAALRQSQERAHALMNFNLNIAGHELRTPLTSLKLHKYS